jgi:hypothetical protein
MTNFDMIKKFGDDPEMNEILSRALSHGSLDIDDGVQQRTFCEREAQVI